MRRLQTAQSEGEAEAVSAAADAVAQLHAAIEGVIKGKSEAVRLALVALLAGGFGVAAGMTAAGLASVFPPLVSGAVGATVLTVVYALVWFYGLRWLRHRTG